MGWLRPVKGRASRTWRLAGLAAVMTTVGIAASFALVPVVVQGLLATLDLTLDTAVWLSMAFEADDDIWTVLATIGRSAADMFMTRRAMAAFGTLVLISSVALYALQRLLGSEEESSR
jgi:hypothetical protein